MTSLPLRRGTAGRLETTTAPRSTHDQLVVLKEQQERTVAEKDDLVRRVREKDERSAELQKTATAAQQRAAKATEELAVQSAERRLVEAAAARAEASSLELRHQVPITPGTSAARGDCIAHEHTSFTKASACEPVGVTTMGAVCADACARLTRRAC